MQPKNQNNKNKSALTRERKIQILTDILNGNPDALKALDEGDIYTNLNDTFFKKNGELVSREQFEKEVDNNPYVTAVRIKTISTGVPLAFSEKEVEERMKQETI